MDDAARVSEAVRKSAPAVVGSWREARGVDAQSEAGRAVISGMEQLLGVFVEFLRSPNSVGTFSRGGRTRELVANVTESQHALGRDAVGVIEDYAMLRRCVWEHAAGALDLSEIGGEAVAGFFVKLLRAADWVTEEGLAVFEEITRREMQAELGRAAATDLVTGLPNTDQFNRLLLPQAVAEWERFCVAIFDVAQFTGMVAAGKVKRARKVLRRLAEAVQEAAPEGSLLARFGDDEVCAILPGVGPEGAYRVAEKVLEGISGGGFEVDVGVAAYPEHASDEGELLGEALAALKMAKRVGGSGIVVARERGKV